MGVAGVVYFLLVTFLKNASWLPAWLNTKLLSAIVASIIALVGTLLAGIPPLSLTAIIGIVGTLYNFIKGWIEKSGKE